MSFDGQVLCQRIVIGPVWARATFGAASAAAVAAPPATLARKARRPGCVDVDFSFAMDVSPQLAARRPWHFTYSVFSRRARSQWYQVAKRRTVLPFARTAY